MHDPNVFDRPLDFVPEQYLNADPTTLDPGKGHLRLRTSVSLCTWTSKKYLKGENLECVRGYTLLKMPFFFLPLRSLPISISPLQKTGKETQFRLSSYPGRPALLRE